MTNPATSGRNETPFSMIQKHAGRGFPKPKKAIGLREISECNDILQWSNRALNIKSQHIADYAYLSY